MTIAEIRKKLLSLAVAVEEIQDALESLCDAQPRPPIEHTPAPETPLPHYRYLPSDWPLIAGRVDLPSTQDLLASEAYRDQYRPGEVREIYAAASTGLGRLAGLLKIPMYKISTCAAGRLLERMNELRRDRYASKWYCEGRYVNDQSGWDDWFPSHVHTFTPPTANSPVTPTPRAISVQLPITMSPEEFDLAFDAEVRKGAIDTWVMTPQGRQHCDFLCVDPAIAQRMTPYPYGGVARNSPVREICVFRIRHDPDRLVRIAERVILRHFSVIP